MPLFFFHFTSQNCLSRDDIGTAFPSLEAAYLDACRSVLEISTDKLRARDDPFNDELEIADEDGRTLMHIPFSEVLRPRPKADVRGRRHATNLAIEGCRRQMLRSQRLRSELRAEFEKIRSTCQSIREKLELSKT